VLEQRVRLAVGHLAVGLPAKRDEVDAELLEQRPDHAAAHPVARVDHDLQALVDVPGLDEPQRAVLELRVEVDLLDAPALGLGLGQAGLDQLADVLDAGVAAEGDRALADELRAGVGFGLCEAVHIRPPSSPREPTRK
jgi:hypothetical protein